MSKDTRTLNDARRLVRAMDWQSNYHDGLVTVPAFLFEQLHNVVFPGCERHEYTESGEVVAGTIAK